MEEKLGSQYVGGRSLDFATSFEESGPATPMFFILSPGVDPLKDVEKHGKLIASVKPNAITGCTFLQEELSLCWPQVRTILAFGNMLNLGSSQGDVTLSMCHVTEGGLNSLP